MTFRSTVTAVAALHAARFHRASDRRNTVKLARESRERRKARNGSKGQEPEKTNSSRRFFKREDKKRKFGENLPKEVDESAPPAQRVVDDTMGATGDSGNMTGPAARPSHASSSSGLNDEDRKRALEQSQQREAKKLALSSGREQMGEMRTRTTRVSVVPRPWWESSR